MVKPAKGLAPQLEQRVGRVIEFITRWLAISGGLALVALTTVTCLSVIGRELSGFAPFFGPIQGDFELVEAGCAFAIFAFLPWCQMRRGHVTVDIFVQPLGPRGLAGLSLVGNVILTACALLIAVKLGEGLIDKRSYSETTFILQMPVWWGYAVALVGAWVFVLASAFTVWRSLNEMLGDGERA
ncbi:TRAP transporter small permease [Breoghania sp.]|uniref:TRAP transporter small permease n=1 Tax=Breoghania sp. TaxID=2065378 RepID=UPI0029CA9FBF|nr:TRAP transporter small permease [Breoghania sp.]